MSVVWSAPEAEAQRLLTLHESEFVDELNHAFARGPLAAGRAGDDALTAIGSTVGSAVGRTVSALAALGTTFGLPGASAALRMGASVEQPPFVHPPLAESCEARASFPLQFAQASMFTAPRVALIGDAAHTVHPMAGQGLNLGIADATTLVEVLGAAADIGADIGAVDVLQKYDEKRRVTNALAGIGIDGLGRMFATDALGFGAARGVGLAALHAATPVKAALASIAAGDADEVVQRISTMMARRA